MTANGERKISSLRDLPQDIAPPRELWQGIEARIAAEPGARQEHGRDAARRFGRAARMRVFAAAAVIAALAVGIWIGRAVLPVPGGQPVGAPPTASNGGSNRTMVEPGSWRAELVMDSKYNRDRAELVKGLE